MIGIWYLARPDWPDTRWPDRTGSGYIRRLQKGVLNTENIDSTFL